MPLLPDPRGRVSAAAFKALAGSPADASVVALDQLVTQTLTELATGTGDGVVEHDDLQLTLFCLYELHYGGFTDVDDAWEWQPGLLSVRSHIEQAFEAELRARVPVPTELPQNAEDIAQALFALAAEDNGPSTARYIAREADVDDVREFLKIQSLYQLKEADPHTWAIPRLRGGPKAALVEIQMDEYGGGRADRMHSTLFADSMRSLGLNPEYGAYLNEAPTYQLVSLNMMSLFGLHRRLRGAIVGHLAAFEMTSSIPCQQISRGFNRLGLAEAAEYFDEHIEADAVHEQIASRDLAGGLGEAEPELIADIFFGAAACFTVDGWSGAKMLATWESKKAAV